MVPIRSASSTLQGRRPANEDAVAESLLPDGRQLLAVADGMGGHASGEIASGIALRTLADGLRAGLDLVSAVRAANRAIHEEASRSTARAGMGTTLVALVRSGAAYEIANVGDSRAYHLDARGIRQITLDHSFAAEAARASQLSAEEIARSPWRNALTRALGTGEEVEVDLFGPFEVPRSPHLVLLCSDGLYRAVPDAEIRRQTLEAPDLATAVERLAALALRNESDDNISIVGIEFGALLGRAGATGSAPRAVSARPRVAAAAPSAAPAPAGPEPARRPAPSAGPAAGAAALPARTAHRRPRWLRRAGEAVLSDGVLFAACLGALLLWFVLNLLAG